MGSVSEENARCVACDGGSESESGKLLVCGENECPVGIHEKCMVVKPQFDDVGNFFCPYCAYKRMVCLCKQKGNKLTLSAVKLADWISKAAADATRHDFQNVKAQEPLLTPRLSNEDEGVQRVPQEENMDASLSASFAALDRKGTRVFWTEQEEQALKEGVKHFWNNTNRKNIPWEKICQSYKDRFHSSRTAANLKDKWKSMTKNAS